MGQWNLRLQAIFQSSTNAIVLFVGSKVVPCRIPQPLWAPRISIGSRVKSIFLLGLRTQGFVLTSVQSVALQCPIRLEVHRIIGCLSVYSMKNHHWKLPPMYLWAQKHRGRLFHNRGCAMKPSQNYPNSSRCYMQTAMPNNAINSDVQKLRFALLLHAGYGERGASVEHWGVGRTAPANPSFERTPLCGFARVSLRALRALRPHASAAQLAPR